MRRAVWQTLPLVLVTLAGAALGGCGNRGAHRERPYSPRVVVYAPCGLEGALEAGRQLLRIRQPDLRVDLILDEANVQVRKVTELGQQPDVFISPGELELKQLRDAGLIDENTVRDFGSLDMAIIVPSSRNDIRGLKDLTSPRVKCISMGDPDSTSMGYYGAQVLRKLGLWEALQPKLLLREAPLEPITLVESGQADAGIVYLTCPLEANPEKVSRSALKVVEAIPRDVCPPIRLQLAVLRDSRNQDAAKRFVDFMISDEAQFTMAGYGVLPPAEISDEASVRPD